MWCSEECHGTAPFAGERVDEGPSVGDGWGLVDIATLRLPVISSYLAFLLALIGLLVINPILRHFALDLRLFEAAFFATLAGGALLSMRQRRQRVFALALFTFTIGCRWGSFVAGPESVVSVAAHLSSVVFFVYTGALIFRSVLETEEVTSDTFYGSVAVYLMMALSFAFLYELIEFVFPDSFAEGDASAFERSGEGFGDYIYFSLTTLTTLGFGDIRPVFPLARIITVLEAVVGQMYVAVLVGRLVGMHIQARRG